MMQAEVRYTQNFSAENADFLKPWVPQDGLRWLELVAPSPVVCSGSICAPIGRTAEPRR